MVNAEVHGAASTCTVPERPCSGFTATRKKKRPERTVRLRSLVAFQDAHQSSALQVKLQFLKDPFTRSPEPQGALINGESTFSLPDLRGRLPIHQGSGFILAETGGAEAVTLTTQQLPTHRHPAAVSSGSGTGPSPGNAIWAASTTEALYAPGPATGDPMAAAVGPVGGGQPHTNLMPYLCISFIISLFGIFPSPT